MSLPQEINISATPRQEKGNDGISPGEVAIEGVIWDAFDANALKNFSFVPLQDGSFSLFPKELSADFDAFLIASGIFPRYDIRHLPSVYDGERVTKHYEIVSRDGTNQFLASVFVRSL